MGSDQEFQGNQAKDINGIDMNLVRTMELDYGWAMRAWKEVKTDAQIHGIGILGEVDFVSQNQKYRTAITGRWFGAVKMTLVLDILC